MSTRRAFTIASSALATCGFTRPVVAQEARAPDCRQIGLIRRKKGMSMADFSRHWREVHAPLGLRALSNARRYVQNHAIESAELPAGLRRASYDGMAEVWFDTPADAAAVADNEAYKRTVKPDEPNFLDAFADDLIGRGTIAESSPVSATEPLTKLVVLLRRADTATDEDFRRVVSALSPSGDRARRLDVVLADPEVDRERRPRFDAIAGVWAVDPGDLAPLWAAMRDRVESVTAAERLAFVAEPTRVRWPA